MEESHPEELGSSRRERVFKEVWLLRYNCIYGEKAGEYLLSRWLSMDQAVRVLGACFATGSAIAGWGLWNSAGGRLIWAALAAITTVLTVLTSAIGVQDRLKTVKDSHDGFLRIRLKAEGLLAKLRIDLSEETAAVEKELFALMQEHAECSPKWSHDVSFTKKQQLKVQEAVDLATIPANAESPTSPPPAVTTTTATLPANGSRSSSDTTSAHSTSGTTPAA